MLEQLNYVSGQELLFILSYVMMLLAGMYIGRKHRVPPVRLSMFVYIVTLAFLVIISMAQKGFGQYPADPGQFRNLIAVLGLAGIVFTGVLVKRLLRIRYIVINRLLGVFLVFYSVFLLTEYLEGNPGLYLLVYTQYGSEMIGTMNILPAHLTSSVAVEIFSNIALIELFASVILTSLFIALISRLKHYGNGVLLLILILNILSFISFFKINPSSLPVLSERMMGLNVVQMGLLLFNLLLIFKIFTKEIQLKQIKNEIRKRPPSEYGVLTIYLVVTLLSIQVSSVFDDLHMKVLFTGYVVTTSLLIFNFMRKVERFYLKYGTVSIILLVFILFLQINIIQTNGGDFQHIDVPEESVQDAEQALGEKSSGDGFISRAEDSAIR